ncbi:MAG: hypothetical protein R3D84_03375 [Paracoccaceae bacterium]
MPQAGRAQPHPCGDDRARPGSGLTGRPGLARANAPPSRGAQRCNPPAHRPTCPCRSPIA